MKIRNGFVSNSSSSSFVISTSDLTMRQYDQLEKHYHHCDRGDSWIINYGKENVTGYTHMDNFDMHHFLETIGVDMKKVMWGD